MAGMDDQRRTGDPARARQRRTRAGRADRPRLQLGVGFRGGPPARAAVDRDLSPRLRGLLLIQQLFPEARALGSLAFVAIGLAFLVKWAIDRGTGSLYAGAIITALAAPGLIEEATNATYDGLGTLCLGIAFLFIAAVRAATSGGIGWQAWLGGLLAIIGVAEMVTLGIGDLLVPLVLVCSGSD